MSFSKKRFDNLESLNVDELNVTQNIICSGNCVISGDILIDEGTLKIDGSNNRVGINKTNPAYTLDVSGNINIPAGSNYLQNGSPLVSSFWSAANGSDIYYMSGNVAIGKTSASHKLDISGNINNNNAYLINGTSVLSSNTLGSGVVNSNLTSVGTLNTLDVSGNTNITNGNLDLNNGKLLDVTNIDTINNNINIRTLSDNDINIIRNTTGTNLSLKATEITTNSDINIGSNTLKGNIDVSGGTINIGNNCSVANIACGNSVQTINMGSGSGVTTINIGHAGDTINIAGNVLNVNTTNLDVSDNLITINKGSSGSGTARNSGIQIRDNNNDGQGYIKVSSLGSFFELQAPENNYILSTPILTRPDTVATVLEIQDEYIKNIGDGSINGNLNLTSGNSYKINNTDVLTGSSLGSGVTSSSLTSVGNLSSGVRINTTNTTHALNVGGIGHIINYLLVGKGVDDPILRQNRNNVDAESFTHWYDTTNNKYDFVYRNGGGGDTIISTYNNLNFGVGVTNPAEKLEVRGNLRVGDGSGYANLTTGSDRFLIAPGGSERMCIKQSSGNVGIGTTDPAYVLHAQNATRGILRLQSTSAGQQYNGIQMVNGSNSWEIGQRTDINMLYFNNPANSGEVGADMVIDNTGNVGINTTSPLTKLQTNFTSSDSTFTGTNKFCGIHIQPETNTNDKYVGLTFGAIDPTEGATRKETQAGIVCQSSSTYGTRMYFLTSNSYGSGMSSRMLLNPNGDLDLSGNMNLIGSNFYKINSNKIPVTLGFSLFLGATPSLNRIRPSGWNVSSGISRVSVGEYTLTLGLNNPTPSQTGICVVSFENNGEHKHRVVSRFGTSTQIAIDTYNNDTLADLEVNASILIIYD